MNRRYGIILIFALVFCVAFGQTYCGTVVENDGLRPLANVSVSLLAQDSILVAFVYTNDKGEFCISPPPYRPAAFLSASYIGFSTLLIPISEYGDGICFKLKQSDVALKEVKVNANRIRWEGDTLIYNVAGFKTPQDRTVRDVLTKIPGIGVSENGDVSYQGEKINVFYIEGLDLLGDKYKLASNNMQANYVKEIQVLENHVPIKSLVGKTFSEQAAINLILEDNAKSALLATFDLGAGISPLKWNNRITGMRFDKQGQQLNLYKNDNTGENLSSEIQSAQGVVQIVENSRNNQWLSPLLNAGTLSSPPIDSKLYRMNDEHLLATNQLYKLDDDSHLRIQLSYLNNILRRENNTRLTYHFPDSTFTIEEKLQQKEKQHHIETGINYTRNSSASYITEHLKASARFDKNSIDMYANHLPIWEKYKRTSFRINNDFKWVIPNEKNRWEIASSFVFDHSPDELEIESVNPIVWSDTIYGIRERIGMSNFIMRNNVQHVFSLKSLQFHLKAGADVIHQRIESSTDPELPMLEDRNFNNEDSYTIADVYFEPQLLYMTDKMTLNGSATISAKHFVMQSGEYDNNISFLPRLNAVYETGWWTFRGHIAVDDRYNTLQTIYPGWIASNYRRLATGETIFQSFVSDSYTLSASYRNPVTSFFFRLSASYNFNHYNYIMQNEFINQLTSMSHVLKYKHTQPGHIYMLNVAKSLATWNTRLFVDATYSQMQSSQILNKIFTTYDNQNISISGRIFVQPLRWFNSQYEMQTSLSRFGVINPLANVYPAMAHVSHKLNTYFVAGKSWQIGVNHNVFHGDAMPEASYFLDATAIFKWNGKEISLLVYNVFNNDTWGYAAYQTFSEYQTQYALVGRYVLARFSFAL